MQQQDWTKDLTFKHWPERKADSHKGSHGKVGIIAGSDLMPGAAALCAGAAVQSGAGLTTVNTVKSVIPVVAAHVPEVTFYHRKDTLKDFYEGKDAIAVGPGLGRLSDEIVKELIEKFEGPLIVDADGLYEINKFSSLIRKREHPLIVTPHPGEMARIIQKTIEYVNNNRYETARDLAADYGICVVLKGPETIVAEPDGKLWLNTTGNAGLAKGGSGDVLTGMILAFTARYKDIQPAVSSAVFMHGFTADYILEQGTAIDSMAASKLVDSLSAAFKKIM